jgi:hypothetical protein
LLASLLVGAPFPGLGDDFMIDQIRFQARAVSMVDDYLVSGKSENGQQRQVAISVRRAPALIPSDRESVQLIGSYLAVLLSHERDISDGRWRLGLVTASRTSSVTQLHDLTEIAQSALSNEEFQAEVGHGRGGLQERLVYVVALVGAAMGGAGFKPDTDPHELTRKMLAALWVHESRLEGGDQQDRVHAVAQLQCLTRGGSAAAANALFLRLEKLATDYAPKAAAVTRSSLRRELRGTLKADLLDPIRPRFVISVAATLVAAGVAISAVFLAAGSGPPPRAPTITATTLRSTLLAASDLSAMDSSLKESDIKPETSTTPGAKACRGGPTDPVAAAARLFTDAAVGASFVEELYVFSTQGQAEAAFKIDLSAITCPFAHKVDDSRALSDLCSESGAAVAAYQYASFPKPVLGYFGALRCGRYVLVLAQASRLDGAAGADTQDEFSEYADIAVNRILALPGA